MPGHKWTEEQKQRMREKARARVAQAAAAIAEPEPEPDAEGDVLADLMASISKLRDKKTGQKKALEDLGKILDRLDPTEHPELADDPTIQAFVERIGSTRIQQAKAQGLPPGTVVGEGIAQQSIPWTEKDVIDLVKDADGNPIWVTLVPSETIPLFFNGVRCQLIADQEVTIPKAFYDLYMESRRARRLAEQHKAYMFGKSESLPAELAAEGEAAVATARVRAYMHLGPEKGGGSILIGTGGLDRRDVAAGGETAEGGEATS